MVYLLFWLLVQFFKKSLRLNIFIKTYLDNKLFRFVASAGRKLIIATSFIVHVSFSVFRCLWIHSDEPISQSVPHSREADESYRSAGSKRSLLWRSIVITPFVFLDKRITRSHCVLHNRRCRIPSAILTIIVEMQELML